MHLSSVTIGLGGSGDDSSGLQAEAIAGTVIGGAFALGVLSAVIVMVSVYFIIKLKNRKPGETENAEELQEISSSEKDPQQEDGQEPTTISCTPHVEIEAMYSEVTATKEETKNAEDFGPMYQDPHTIEQHEAPSGDMYAMPQISAKGKKKGKVGEREVQTGKKEAAMFSVPDKPRGKLKTEREKTKKEEAPGPMYQDPHTIELQEAPSGDMYAMPQISAKGKKKVKTGSAKVETEEDKTTLHSTPPKQRKTAKKQEWLYGDLDINPTSKPPLPPNEIIYANN